MLTCPQRHGPLCEVHTSGGESSLGPSCVSSPPPGWRSGLLGEVTEAGEAGQPEIRALGRPSVPRGQETGTEPRRCSDWAGRSCVNLFGRWGQGLRIPVLQGLGAESKYCSLSVLSFTVAWGSGRAGEARTASTQHWEQEDRTARCLLPPVCVQLSVTPKADRAGSLAVSVEESVVNGDALPSPQDSQPNHSVMGGGGPKDAVT